MTGAPHVYVVTCRVPSGSVDRLRVDVAGRTVTAADGDGFRHTFELPAGVDVERLGWEIYAGVLELRAPYRAGAHETPGA